VIAGIWIFDTDFSGHAVASQTEQHRQPRPKQTILCDGPFHARCDAPALGTT
jgi:hypothetical protein